MNPSNKDIVVATWKTFSTRDAARIQACFTEDAVWIAPPRNATALAVGRGEINRMNREQIADFIAHDFGRLFVADVNIEFSGVYGEGDTVVLEQRTRATLANGHGYDIDYCFVFKVRDGRVCQMREYMDTLNGFRQIFGEGALNPVSAVV